MSEWLEHLKAAHEAATPGPWEWDTSAIRSGEDLLIWPGNSILSDELGTAGVVGAFGHHAEAHADDNLALIVLARNHLSKLLAIAEAAERWGEAEQAQARAHREGQERSAAAYADFAATGDIASTRAEMFSRCCAEEREATADALEALRAAVRGE